MAGRRGLSGLPQGGVRADPAVPTQGEAIATRTSYLGSKEGPIRSAALRAFILFD